MAAPGVSAGARPLDELGRDGLGLQLVRGPRRSSASFVYATLLGVPHLNDGIENAPAQTGHLRADAPEAPAAGTA